MLAKVEQARAGGAPIRAQIAGLPVGLIIGLAFSRHPFLACPSYQEVAQLDLPERIVARRQDLSVKLIIEQWTL